MEVWLLLHSKLRRKSQWPMMWSPITVSQGLRPFSHSACCIAFHTDSESSISCIVWTVTEKTGTSCSNTLNIVQERLPKRVCELNPSPHSCLFASVSKGSSRFSYLFTSAMLRLLVHTAPKCSIEPIQFVMLHFWDQYSFVTEITTKSPFLCVNRNLVWYDFCANAKATCIRYSVNI